MSIYAYASKKVDVDVNDISSRDIGLHFGLSSHTHPYFVCVNVYASSEGSGKFVHRPSLLDDEISTKS